MKRFAKLIAVLLVAALFLAFGLTACADNPTKGRIRFYFAQTEDGSGQVDGIPRLHRIFPATLAFDENGEVVGISYTCTDEQKAIPGFDTVFTVDAANNVGANPDAYDHETMTFKPEAVRWIQENLDVLATPVGVVTKVYWDINPSIQSDTVWGQHYGDYEEFGNLPFGYYYVDSEVGSLAMIDSLHPDAEIHDKHVVPGMDKTIEKLTTADGEDHSGDVLYSPEPGTGSHGALVQLGDTVEYHINVHAQKGAQDYRVTDVQSRGLTLLPDTVRVTLNGETVDSGDYTLYTAVNPVKLWTIERRLDGGEKCYDLYRGASEDGGELVAEDIFRSPSYHYESIGAPDNGSVERCPNILVLFHQDFLDRIGEASELVVSYQCVINKDAVIGAANPNEAKLHYGHDKSIVDHAAVYSGAIRVFKYEGEGTSHSSPDNRPLNGVGFILRNEDGKYYSRDAETGAVHWVDRDQAQTRYSGEDAEGEPYTEYKKLDFGWYDPVFNPGNDGKTDTADDQLFWPHHRIIQLAGPDAQLQTADDLCYDAFGNRITPGEDGVFGTADDTWTIYPQGSGFLAFDGLTAGTYTLIETEPLPGYNVAADMEIVISAAEIREQGIGAIIKKPEILNQTGTELPTTGGMGVTLFHVLGMGMMLAAGVALTRKKNALNG